MTASVSAIPELQQLRDSGLVLLPGDAGYEAACQPWNVAVVQRPAAVATPTSPEEVSAVVRAALDAGLRIAPQATGHSAGPLPSLDDVLLVRTTELIGVSVDPVGRQARVGSGVLWEDVVNAAAPHGLAALHGSSPDVGVTGYSLGGGMGWFARKHGMATSSISAVEIVLPDGQLVRASDHDNVDLFWALRGGGGSFGIVTALEFALFPIESAYAGALVWDWHDAERVLTGWAAWTFAAPDEATTSFRILQLPPIEQVPEPLRGRQVAMIDGAVLADDETAEEILRPLRELGPELDMFARMPAPALVRLHGDPEGPTPVVTDSLVLSALPDAAACAFVAAAGPDSGSSMITAELRQLGGALGRPAAKAGALGRIEGQFVAFGAAMAMDPASERKGANDTRQLMEGLRPWGNGRAYLNFTENAVDTEPCYEPEAFRRLCAIRAAVDPGGRMLANHPIPLPV